MLKINGIEVKTPSSFTWGLQDLSSEDTGRTLDGVMHKDLIAQKRKLDCVWNNLTRQETAILLQAVNSSVFLQITYPDALTGTDQTRTFYTGDKTAPVLMWVGTKQIYSTITFNFIEK